MAVKDFDFLGSAFGTATENLRAKAGTKVEQTIKEWLRERIDVAQAELESSNRNASGSLSASIRPKDLVTNGEEVLVEVIAEDYWDFINQGVNGTVNKFGSPYSFKNLVVGMKMHQAFKEFIQLRGIQPREPEMDYDQLAYILAKATKKKGIRKTPFMDEGFSPEAIKDLADRLGKTVKRIFE